MDIADLPAEVGTAFYCGRCTNRCTKSFRPCPISPTVAVTAEVASSSLVVPAIHSERVTQTSMKPTRVQKDTFLHPFCVLSTEASLPSLRVSYAQLCCTSETSVPVSTGENTSESTAACAACFAGVIACV